MNRSSFRTDYTRLIIAVAIPTMSLFLAACSFEETREARVISQVPVTPKSAFMAPASPPSNSSNPNSQKLQEAPRNNTLVENSLPSQLNLDVPFYSQAPYGDWGMPYQEACEEASLLLAYYYLTEQNPSREQFHQDLLKMVEWEKSYFGSYEHTTVAQTAEMARVYLGLPDESVEILDHPGEDALKIHLAAGHPIVTPMAGRYLGNPYFTGFGPVYHMLVLRGYDEKGRFITNDVGTRHGENFSYDIPVFMNAIHNWHDSAASDPEGILKGKKMVLVLKSQDPSTFINGM